MDRSMHIQRRPMNNVQIDLNLELQSITLLKAPLAKDRVSKAKHHLCHVILQKVGSLVLYVPEYHIYVKILKIARACVIFVMMYCLSVAVWWIVNNQVICGKLAKGLSKERRVKVVNYHAILMYQITDLLEVPLLHMIINASNRTSMIIDTMRHKGVLWIILITMMNHKGIHWVMLVNVTNHKSMA